MDETQDPPRGRVAALAGGLALLGGLSLGFVAALTTVSVLLRWTTSQPVRGDVEMISLGAGLAVLCFLAYGTLMRANILVDSFTGWLPRGVTAMVDGFWMLVWAVVALVLARGMAIGAWEALHTHTTTIGLLGVPIWWVIAIGAFCFAATSATALCWSWRFLRGRG